ncbi:hypothetical protein [Pandoravirus japonicus]|uniref:Uncharacterized protein n=1 Tax=Pandoravirus japonicus TaxID=2823154 RepID=A0A811BSL0_9VIRU|nr:hypothetical protein [Pandoravirus japonicus]
MVGRPAKAHSRPAHRGFVGAQGIHVCQTKQENKKEKPRQLLGGVRESNLICAFRPRSECEPKHKCSPCARVVLVFGLRPEQLGFMPTTFAFVLGLWCY